MMPADVKPLIEHAKKSVARSIEPNINLATEIAATARQVQKFARKRDDMMTVQSPSIPASTTTTTATKVRPSMACMPSAPGPIERAMLETKAAKVAAANATKKSAATIRSVKEIAAKGSEGSKSGLGCRQKNLRHVSQRATPHRNYSQNLSRT